MHNKIILFDGVCHFCNFWVKFVLSHDIKKQFKFAPLQSETAQSLLNQYHIDQLELSTVVLIDDHKIYLRSDAALRICKYLDGIWRIIYGLQIFPSSWRNALYDLIARNRYKWFGKTDTCMLPSADAKDRFLNSDLLTPSFK
jgi:predicted DCC family thiol-disulfide oxidoreductase YuxK